MRFLRSSQAENDHERFVERPHLVRRELTDAAAEPLRVDRAKLLHEHTR